MAKILEALQDLVESCLINTDSPVAGSINDPSDAPKSGRQENQTRVRIQLKLSPALVRVLQTVRKEQVKASELVESVLWSSTRVQDTAQLAGIRRPGQAPAA